MCSSTSSSGIGLDIVIGTEQGQEQSQIQMQLLSSLSYNDLSNNGLSNNGVSSGNLSSGNLSSDNFLAGDCLDSGVDSLLSIVPKIKEEEKKQDEETETGTESLATCPLTNMFDVLNYFDKGFPFFFEKLKESPMKILQEITKEEWLSRLDKIAKCCDSINMFRMIVVPRIRDAMYKIFSQKNRNVPPENFNLEKKEFVFLDCGFLPPFDEKETSLQCEKLMEYHTTHDKIYKECRAFKNWVLNCKKAFNSSSEDEEKNTKKRKREASVESTGSTGSGGSSDSSESLTKTQVKKPKGRVGRIRRKNKVNEGDRPAKGMAILNGPVNYNLPIIYSIAKQKFPNLFYFICFDITRRSNSHGYPERSESVVYFLGDQKKHIEWMWDYPRLVANPIERYQLCKYFCKLLNKDLEWKYLFKSANAAVEAVFTVGRVRATTKSQSTFPAVSNIVKLSNMSENLESWYSGSCYKSPLFNILHPINHCAVSGSGSHCRLPEQIEREYKNFEVFDYSDDDIYELNQLVAKYGLERYFNVDPTVIYRTSIPHGSHYLVLDHVNSSGERARSIVLSEEWKMNEFNEKYKDKYNEGKKLARCDVYAKKLKECIFEQLHNEACELGISSEDINVYAVPISKTRTADYAAMRKRGEEIVEDKPILIGALSDFLYLYKNDADFFIPTRLEDYTITPLA